ncbi:dTTP/UTP pyrophosphatase isoform X2 [Prorops nasuta]|uniref:dTTP/UTP pyrophosphatase isoform X2 n=1 Tax=Prorops nasuta TaxID=863751 RepID=UPI0034CE9773
MLEPTKQSLAGIRVVLASGSPRRREIISKLGINAEVIPSLYDETLDRSEYVNHGVYVEDLARYKVREVFERLKFNHKQADLIIGADTLVTLGDEIYGKPKDKMDAFNILTRLSNKEHIVYTGVCLKTPLSELVFHELTLVKFGDITKEQINAYIDTGEPLDKAGGYGVQGVGGCLVEKINVDGGSE